MNPNSGFFSTRKRNRPNQNRTDSVATTLDESMLYPSFSAIANPIVTTARPPKNNKPKSKPYSNDGEGAINPVETLPAMKS